MTEQSEIRWEYVVVRAVNEHLTEALNKKGEGGWELVSTLFIPDPRTESTVTLFFRRAASSVDAAPEAAAVLFTDLPCAICGEPNTVWHHATHDADPVVLGTEKGLTPAGQHIADCERDAARWRTISSLMTREYRGPHSIFWTLSMGLYGDSLDEAIDAVRAKGERNAD